MASSSRFAVAIHILVDLSLSESNQVKSSNAMAIRANTNPVVIRRLYCQLQEAGLVKTKSGKFGGAYLAKSPKAISLWEIYEAIDEATIFSYNPNAPYQKCPISCAMHEILEPVFDSALDALKTRLKRQKLSQLTLRCRKIANTNLSSKF